MSKANESILWGLKGRKARSIHNERGKMGKKEDNPLRFLLPSEAKNHQG